MSDAETEDALAAGETTSDSFTAKDAENHAGVAGEQANALTICTNDAPAITSAAHTGAVSEGDDGASQSATGQVTFSDVDTSDTHIFSLSSADRKSVV